MKLKTAFKIWLGSLGFSYCPNCGDDLWFDDERFALGYNVHSICLRCKDLRRFDIPSDYGRTIETIRPS